MITPRQTVIMDAGTTVYHTARYLEPLTLQLVTNSLPVANLFASHQRTEVVVSGGVIYPRVGVLVGPMAVDTFRKTHADVAIMSAGGITAKGVTNSHALLVDIQRAMMQAASRVILCLDHTKLGRRSIAQLCGLEQIDLLITDDGASPEALTELRENGLEIVLASQEGEIAEKLQPTQDKARPEMTLAAAEPEEDTGFNVASWD
jgi:DeoR/GlpR family transcriptional regulator of sugar metabolism